MLSTELGTGSTYAGLAITISTHAARRSPLVLPRARSDHTETILNRPRQKSRAISRACQPWPRTNIILPPSFFFSIVRSNRCSFLFFFSRCHSTVRSFVQGSATAEFCQARLGGIMMGARGGDIRSFFGPTKGAKGRAPTKRNARSRPGTQSEQPPPTKPRPRMPEKISAG